MYLFFIAEEFVLDNVEAPKAKEEGENMPNQIASLVEKMLKEQVHLKVEFDFEPCLSMWVKMYTLFYNALVLSSNLPLLCSMLLPKHNRM